MHKKIHLGILGIVLLAVMVVVSTNVIIMSIKQEQKECCLCESFRYHAPCLVDLETGNVLELEIYDPHPVMVAELAEEQYSTGTFSFLRCGKASGIRDTSSRRIEMDVPIADRTKNPALCKSCQKLLQAGYEGRYVLADLYDARDKRLIPITDQTKIELRCYEISIEWDLEKNETVIIVQGVLQE